MNNSTTKTTRLASLDALRGFDMLWIIGGETVIHNLAKATDIKVLQTLSVQMNHVPWKGFHFYDLIMPLFLFMAGVSIPFSTDKRLASGESKNKIYAHALKRSAILFLLGMMCQCNLLAFDINKLFIIHDTLQSIAIGYLFAVLICTRLNLKKQLLLTSALVFSYWLILTFIPVPGQAAGVLEPHANIAKYVEQQVFGRFDDAAAPYTWFLSSIGFIATVMSGVFAAHVISGNFRFKAFKFSNIGFHKTVLLAATGVLLVAFSLLFAIWFPVIKPIWNPTFIILSSGLSFMLLSLFYFVIDVKGYQRWAFWLKVIGMNSIAVYMATHFINFKEIVQNVVFGLEQFTGAYYPVIISASAVLLIYGMLYWMYEKGSFIKL